MSENVFRVFTEKRSGYDIAAASLFADLTKFLGAELRSLRLILRYDALGMSSEGFERAVGTVFSEPMVDNVYLEELPELPEDARLLAYEALPGQFDMRADSCAQCVQMLLGGERPEIRCATVLVLEGVSDEDYRRIENYVINPVESCRAELARPSGLSRDYPVPENVGTVTGFREKNREELAALIGKMGLAMSVDDTECMREYFASEGRDPSVTEIRVLDTYWSDHCRHTTFNTMLDNVDIRDKRVKKAYDLYLSVSEERPVTLMNMATAAMRELRREGKLKNLYESGENNACTVKVNVVTQNGTEPWLLLFKNETHNHPTEIEPFGGAATCIGGAIRDPLSGRAFVYQAMRVTGSGDPRAPLSETLQGKLPQRKLTQTAAAGYSSYGNQIGLATGLVREVYHPGYIAKRMEIGAVVGAVRESHVRAEEPMPGDIVLLLGGRTGRDGIGGATGSSKTHDIKSVSDCAAEVQKGNAPEERKIQRLFRSEKVTGLIKRCNDFGAGGVAVAIGELAPGLTVNLDKVPKKYGGLDGTEIAISESQERMAVVVAPEDAELFISFAGKENIECTAVATVTEEPRLRLTWRGEPIVDISREFLDSAGAKAHADVIIPKPRRRVQQPWENETLTCAERVLLLASDLNFCSQRGLAERFDSSVGASTVLSPYGGKNLEVPEQVMAALFPVYGAETGSVMSWAFDPYVSEADPFTGAEEAVVESLAKLVGAGCSVENAYLTLQEYFPRPGTDPERWGMPAAAVLGAFNAQLGLGVAAIGGKDSMSGSFERLDVPPTLCSFAIAHERAEKLLPSAFCAPGSYIVCVKAPVNPDGSYDFPVLRSLWLEIYGAAQRGLLISGYACGAGGVIGALAHMTLGGHGAEISKVDYNPELWDVPAGSLVLEAKEPLGFGTVIGRVTEKPELALGSNFIPLTALREAWSKPLESVFPTTAPETAETAVPRIEYHKRAVSPVHLLNTAPCAVIPVFPGTNSEYDTAAALEAAGAHVEMAVIRNLKPSWLEESLTVLEEAIRSSQMIVLPGGFSGGDEPDGSGKFITSLFRSERITDAVRDLLNRRGGLILGICNGFQALVKLGLLPYGDIRKMDEGCPTLTFNSIGRHQARYVNTAVSSVLSPWLSRMDVGDIHTVPVSHGEGRFAASAALLERMRAGGQIAFQYCDTSGNPGMSADVNPNGSVLAIEGITSPDGRVLGKMAHTERSGRLVGRNIPGNKLQPLFEGGVGYFK